MPRLSENLPPGAKLSFPTRPWMATSGPNFQTVAQVAHVQSVYVGDPEARLAMCRPHSRGLLEQSGQGLDRCPACVTILRAHGLWPL